MSDIFASLAAGTARPSTGTSGAGGETAVRVVDPSPELARIATGENLRGTVVGRDEHGHLQVRTRLGVLTLAVPRSLPVGTEVVLQVRSVGPQVILNLLPLDAAAPGGAPPAQGAQPLPGTPAPLPAAPADLVERGQVLRAVLHAPPPMAALTGLPTAQPGSELLARILSLGVQAPLAGGTPPTPPTAPSLAFPPGASPPAAGTPAGLPGAAAPAGITVPPPAAAGGVAVPAGASPVVPGRPAGAPTAAAAGGATAGLRLAPQAPVAASGHSLATALQGASAEAVTRAIGALAPGTAPVGGEAAGSAPAALPGALRLTGLVAATTSGGQPILHTALGTLTLDTRAALPIGTSLALEVALPAADSRGGPILPPAWPGLEGLEETLLHGLPAAQAEALTRALPQVGPRLASGMLFFLSALNQGNVAGWLAQAGGGTARSESSDGLADRLGREIAGLARSVETPAGEWRFVNLPLWSEQGLRELRCFFRHQEHGGRGDGDDDKATRFVLELELKQHGELQLDGLVRGRLFDLVLRSRRPLPALVRGDLLALFEEANAIAGYSGRLAFQASQNWLQLLAARGAARPHEGVRV